MSFKCKQRVVRSRLAATLTICLPTALLGTFVSAQESDAVALAKAAQNPIADMISLPLQNNTNFGFGPLEKTQDVLNIQPVLPFSLNANWNLVTRTIVPVISQPASTPDEDSEFGIGDIQFSAFFSPNKVVDGWVWGVGAISQLDTAADNRLGDGGLGLGPTAVALHLGKSWVYGALIYNLWSVSTDEGRSSVNQMLFEPFFSYNFPKSPGRYLVFDPVITADWEADSGQRWVVPPGLGIGQIMHFRKQPVNLQASAYYYVERPDNAASWQLRLQLQLLFPK